MTTKTPFRVILFLVVIISVVACMPVGTTEPPATIEPATPTPEIFNPLDPSPTPSDSTLPLTCQVTDLHVYVNEEWGYCFAYPVNFSQDDSRETEGIIKLDGPALDDNPEPVRVSLELTTQAIPEGSELSPLVDAYLTSFHELSGTITRQPVRLGNEPAETLEPVPGLLSSRMIMALHDGILFTLRFHPSDIEIAKPDLDALTQTVIGSFAYLQQTDKPASRPQTVSWHEFGRNISLSYDPILAPWVEAQTVPAIPVNDQILFSESHPAYAQIRFMGFQGGRTYELPLLPAENRVAQVMVFQTADFPGFGDDNPQGFINQSQALKDLLLRDVEPARCAQPITGEPALPFLPWLNAKQSLCAQPQIIEFSGGRGIRYLTYYSQGVGPVLDQHVFYTFQGLTDDGQFHISALLPVQTGIFPTQAPACPQCGEPDYDPFPEWMSVLTEQVTQLNAQPVDEFAPSLTMLDDVIKSIHIDN